MRTYATGTALFVTLALFGTVLTAPGAAEDVPLVNVAVGDAHYADFDLDENGWTTTEIVPPPAREAPENPSWAHGAPTSGPGAAASGSNVWATNLAGDYPARECSGIMSPPIDLTNATSAEVSFMHWRHIEASTFSGNGFDGGIVFATSDGGDTLDRLVPSGGYDASLFSTARRCLDAQSTGTSGFTGPAGSTPPAPTYSAVSIDLSDHVGGTVQIVLGFASDCCTHRAGWYVDDFNVTVDGTSTVEDFETDDGGFSVVGVRPGGGREPLGWEHGVASVGPDTDSPLWATNLDGDHGANECSWIESPPIDLGGLAGTGAPATRATLSWSQWYRSSSFSAGGVVQVSTNGVNYTNMVPAGGYPGDPSSSVLDECLQHRTQESGAMAGSVDSLDGPMVPYEVDISEYLGQTVTVRFLFAVSDTSVSNEGWYVDNVGVSLWAYVGEPHTPEDLPVPGLGGSDAPFWSSGGEDSSWAYGIVTDESSNADTWRGLTGYATNLDGSHNNPECSWIRTPSIPGTVLATDPSLVFQHAYRIAGASVNVAWGGGLVQVSGDGGLTWDYLDLPEYDRPLDYSGGYPACFTDNGAPLDGNVFSGAHHNQFETVTVDLSDYASSPTVEVRFLFGAKTFTYEGWFISDVQMGGVDIL